MDDDERAREAFLALQFRTWRLLKRMTEPGAVPWNEVRALAVLWQERFEQMGATDDKPSAFNRPG